MGEGSGGVCCISVVDCLSHLCRERETLYGVKQRIPLGSRVLLTVDWRGVESGPDGASPTTNHHRNQSPGAAVALARPACGCPPGLTVAMATQPSSSATYGEGLWAEQRL